MRLYDFVEEILPTDTEPALRNKVYSSLYDIYLSYIQDEASYLLDKIIGFLDKTLIIKYKIKIEEFIQLNLNFKILCVLNK